MSLEAAGDRMLVSSSAQAALEHTQGLLASATTTSDEQVAHIVAFLASDLFGEEEDRKRAEKEALVNQLAGGHTAHLEAASQQLSDASSRRTAGASAPTLLANDLVASDIAEMQVEQEELLKKLTGQGLLAAEARVRSQSDPDVVDQIIGALANEENGTEEGALLTSEFNGEVGASAQLLSTTSSDESAHALLAASDIVAADIATTQAEQEALLDKLTGAKLAAAGGNSVQLLSRDIVANDIANTQAEQEALLDKLTGAKLVAKAAVDDSNEVVDEVIENLSSTNDVSAEAQLLATEYASTPPPPSPTSAPKTLAHSYKSDTDPKAEHIAKTDKHEAPEYAPKHSKDSKDNKDPHDSKKLDKADNNSKPASSATTYDKPTSAPPSYKYSKPTSSPPVYIATPALALEASAVSATRLRASDAATAMAAEQDHLPHVLFGGAFLLVATALLTVMTRRSRRARLSAPQDDAYAYFLHE